MPGWRPRTRRPDREGSAHGLGWPVVAARTAHIRSLALSIAPAVVVAAFVSPRSAGGRARASAADQPVSVPAATGPAQLALARQHIKHSFLAGVSGINGGEMNCFDRLVGGTAPTGAFTYPGYAY